MRRQSTRLFLAGISLLFGMAFETVAQESKVTTSLVSEVSENAVDVSAKRLAAGPIHVKLQDGQLRYLRVGDKEVVRRIYFAVRDGNWATAMPRYTKMMVDDQKDHFTVEMAAECKMGKVDFSWTGKIIGSADGKIVFSAEGTPNADFDSNRIGLCVLFGTPSLAEQEFETDGTTPARGKFPTLVSPTHVADQFHKIQYTTASGLHVAVASEGAIFDMEDQRNWCDSSWKAFAPLPYAYKHVGKSDVKAQTITLTVTGVTPDNSRATPLDPARLEIGSDVPGAIIPTLVPPGSMTRSHEFTDISFKHDAFKTAPQIQWASIPTTHLPDDDTVIENLPAIADQAKTIHSFNPTAELRVGPIGFVSKGEDPRASQPIAAMWIVGMTHSLALGGVKEAEFNLKADMSTAAMDAVRPYANWRLVNVSTSSRHVLAFGCTNDHEKVVFLVNKIPHVSHAELGLSPTAVKVLHVAPGAKEQSAEVAVGGLKVELAPYEVIRVTIGK